VHLPELAQSTPSASLGGATTWLLVARDAVKLEALATRLRVEAGVAVDVVRTDLTWPADLAALETHLSEDDRIGILVNNAGTSAKGDFLDQSAEEMTGLVELNVVALTLLSRAAGQRFAAAGAGTIVNIGSVVGLAPEFGMTVYGATKAFVLYLSQGLQQELGPRGVYVQAVLPAATRTEIWAKAGRDLAAVQGVMEVELLVDAALAGFDRHELVTIPALPDEAPWTAYEAARLAMTAKVGQGEPARRYRAAG
jgi:hypothetical protein